MAIDDYTARRAPQPASFLASTDEIVGEMMAYTVTEFVEQCNLALLQAFPVIYIEGEVASFTINQKKWVFFDLKESDEANQSTASQSVSCFIPLVRLNFPLADGMRVRLRATPRLTRSGRFSLTVDRVLPLGEGSLQKSLLLLREKLTKLGLFDPARKRPLPATIQRIGVISSVNAAGYADFLKILGARWGGMQIFTANVQVQGLAAPEQVIRALDYFNQSLEVDVIAILRGGGSADDLSAFNDEALVRAVAASRIPIIAGIGHEVDESLVDLAADVRASTPSNAAELLTPDKRVVAAQVSEQLERVYRTLTDYLTESHDALATDLERTSTQVLQHIQTTETRLADKRRLLDSLNPERVLRRGYAVLRGKLSPGETIEITTYQSNIQAEVTHVTKRH